MAYAETPGGSLVLNTDSNVYSAKATSIDINASYYGGSSRNWTYTWAVEAYISGAWTAKKLVTGSFKIKSPVKSVAISSLGLTAGKTYNVRVRGYFNDSVVGAKETLITNSMSVIGK